jgi:hypothetical protein
MPFRLEKVLSHLIHYRYSPISGVCLDNSVASGKENNRNVNTRKQNGYFVTTVYETQNFSVAFEMLLKFSKKIISRSIN